jgi:hypothetical protein
MVDLLPLCHQRLLMQVKRHKKDEGDEGDTFPSDKPTVGQKVRKALLPSYRAGWRRDGQMRGQSLLPFLERPHILGAQGASLQMPFHPLSLVPAQPTMQVIRYLVMGKAIGRAAGEELNLQPFDRLMALGIGKEFRSAFRALGEVGIYLRQLACLKPSRSVALPLFGCQVAHFSRLLCHG